MRPAELTPIFVDAIPRDIPEGVLFISETYSTAIHKCCCGCGREVVTPLSPPKWRLRRVRANMVTLYPSIGNWSFPCRSHYWIRNNRVEWAGDIPAKQVQAVQRRDRLDSERHIWLANHRKAHRESPLGYAVPGAKSSPPVAWLTGALRRVLRLLGNQGPGRSP